MGQSRYGFYTRSSEQSIYVTNINIYFYISFYFARFMNGIATTLVIVLFLGITPLLHAQEAPDEKGFTLVKEKDNIFVYERWITFPKTDPPVEAREVMGIFHVKTSIEKALALVRNESKIKQWQSHVEKFKVYPQTDSTWYEYSYHDIPWPVSDQDHFLIYEIKESLPGQRLFLTFESIENNKLAPVDKDAHRMRLAGSWNFEKKGSSVKITYRILSMPSSIPRIFTDPVIRSNLMSTVKSYISLLEDQN